jgi:hypothetical protein
MMANRTHLFLRRIVYNGKLNREKCIVHKKKFLEKKIWKRNFQTFHPKDPQEPDWIFIILAALVTFSFTKWIKKM